MSEQVDPIFIVLGTEFFKRQLSLRLGSGKDLLGGLSLLLDWLLLLDCMIEEHAFLVLVELATSHTAEPWKWLLVGYASHELYVSVLKLHIEGQLVSVWIENDPLDLRRLLTLDLADSYSPLH